MIRRVAQFLGVAALYAITAMPLTAQELATLIADSIVVDPTGEVTAEGNVTIFYQGTTMEAARVRYTRAGDTLVIEGPIRVTEPSGNVLTATQATLDQRLENGVLTSARLVLDRQLQLAANEITRVGNRYTTLNRAVASSCRVCNEDETPLWDIRADRVIHDAVEQQLYFEHAQIRIAGIPVFYVPRLRLPDPTLERTTGFLIPRFRTSSDLGTGLKLPYFIAIGDHADATITPYVSSGTSTVELQFRQEFRLGSLRADGAITHDDIAGDRGYFFANAKYLLPRDFTLELQTQFVSDPGYLFQYDYSENDRLTNEIAISRVRDKDRFRASITEFRTLRETEIPIRDTLPDSYVEVGYQRDLPELSFGGVSVLSVDAAALNRPSSADIVGRDVSRIGLGLDWWDTAIFGPGIVARAELGMRVDAYNIGQDTTYPTNVSRVVPRAATELRWPLVRLTEAGATETFEPIFRLDIADAGKSVPLEDSRVIEFDEANLFAASRFPGIDGAEDGLRAALGASWRRADPAGWAMDLSAGRIARLDGTLGFEGGSGLTGDQSEWLVAGRFSLGESFWVATRALFDDNVAFTLSETRIDWKAEDWSLASSYVLAKPEPSEGRTDRLSEWSFGGSLGLSDGWTARTDWRYDFTAGRAARAGIGLEYLNECIRVQLDLTRRFANSASVTPTTDFGFRVSLLGVGNGAASTGDRKSCRG